MKHIRLVKGLGAGLDRPETIIHAELSFFTGYPGSTPGGSTIPYGLGQGQQSQEDK